MSRGSSESIPTHILNVTCGKSLVFSVTSSMPGICQVLVMQQLHIDIHNPGLPVPFAQDKTEVRAEARNREKRLLVGNSVDSVRLCGARAWSPRGCCFHSSSSASIFAVSS